MTIDLCSLEPNRLISLDDALSLISSGIQPIDGVNVVAIHEALGRVLAKDVFSPINLPFDRNSAMDGYALIGSDIAIDGPFTLKLAGIAWAGKPFEGKVESGNCVRIFTGAVVPDGADSVVMQEQARADGDAISFPAGIRPYENIRQAGEEIQQNGLLCAKGKKLNPADIGLLVSAGIDCVPVYPILNIAIFSTGDELTLLNQALTPGKIYDSNRFVLNDLLIDPRYDCVDMGIYADDKRLLKNRIKRMSQVNDVIVSTGGASVGDADYIKEVLAKLGEVTIWKIAVKPGKPLIFGKIGSCYYFGLPGNPVSMMMTFQQIVAPALNRLSGAAAYKPLRFSATCTTALKKSPGRQEFQRGILSQDSDGRFWVASTGHQGSHLLSSMSRANCYIILPAEVNGLTEGETVLVEPFSLQL